MFGKRKVSLTNLTCQSLEATRMALEVLHGVRIHFWQMDINPDHQTTDTETVDIEGVYTRADSSADHTLWISLKMKKDDRSWVPQRADLNISHDRKFYHARWELKAWKGGAGTAVMIAPSHYYVGVKYYSVGTSDTNRWNELI